MLVVTKYFRSALQNTADQHWSALPQRFRPVIDAAEHIITPFERDFRISIRLNHLHVLFLLPPIIEIAQEILSLVVEAVLVRDELANSGTTLSWKAGLLPTPQEQPRSVLSFMTEGCPLRVAGGWHDIARNDGTSCNPGP